MLLVLASTASAQTRGGKSVQSGYAPVNGLKMYYETHGQGDPLVIVHGGVVGITMFGRNIDGLAKNHKVIAAELQGHAHTADINRPLSYEAMADDIFALLKEVRVPRRILWGIRLEVEWRCKWRSGIRKWSES